MLLFLNATHLFVNNNLRMNAAGLEVGEKVPINTHPIRTMTNKKDPKERKNRKNMNKKEVIVTKVCTARREIEKLLIKFDSKAKAKVNKKMKRQEFYRFSN